MSNEKFGNNLDNKEFNKSIDNDIFKEILKLHRWKKVNFIERKDFDAKGGNFIEEDGEDKIGKKYILNLPKNLKKSELPGIIYRINKLTFGDELPKYASTNELKVKIILAINFLLKNSDKKENKKIILKYTKLYSQLFGEKYFLKLSNKNYRESILKEHDLENFKDYEQKIIEINTKIGLKKIQDNVDNLLSYEFSKHFEESFFENGSKSIATGLRTITEIEQEKILNKKGLLIYKKIDSKKLDKKERLLRKKIGIEKLKQDLKEVKNSHNEKLIEKKEIEITNKILNALYEYTYQSLSLEKGEGYSSKGILEKKEILCVGFSLIGHGFLSEIGIEHKSMYIPGHSTLDIRIGGKQYYFDATEFDTIKEFEYGNKKGEFSHIKFINKQNKVSNNMYAYSENPEKGLIAQIYNNQGLRLYANGDNEKAVIFYKKSLKFSPKAVGTYSNLGNVLTRLKKYDEAIESFDNGIKSYPYDFNNYFNKSKIESNRANYEGALKIINNGLQNNKNLRMYREKAIILTNLKKYYEAVKIYKKILKYEPNDLFTIENLAALYLENTKEYLKAEKVYFKIQKIAPNNIKAHFFRGKALFKLKRHNEALLEYDKAEAINPNITDIYYNKSDIYYDLGDYNKALFEINRGIEKSPKNNKYYKVKGYIFLKIGNEKLVFLNNIILNGDDGTNPNKYQKERLEIKNAKNYKILHLLMLKIEKEELK